MEGAGWLSQSFQPPARQELVDEKMVPKPSPKPRQLPEIGPRMCGIRSDAELATFLSQNKQRQKDGAAQGALQGPAAVIEFGASWCTKCHEMFPTFYALTKKFPGHSYAVAQLETLSAASTAGLRYTPTFCVYRGGRKVDEVVGKEPQKLEDHLWLHADG